MGKKRSRRRSRGNWFTKNSKMLAIVLAGAFTVGVVTVAMNRPAPIIAAPEPPPAATEEAPAPQKLSIAFIGDSWAGGAGADGAGTANSYAGKASATLGWNELILPGGGTGYTTPEEPFINRVQQAIDFNPDVVVVQGSSNDYQATFDQINGAANEVFAQLRAGLPDAKIYAVGVVTSPSTPAKAMDTSRAAVSAAAAANGVTWVDANGEGWLDINTDFIDGYHPNEEGHRKVAERLAALLSPLATA